MLFHTVLNNKKQIYSDWLQDEVYNLGDTTFVIPTSYQYDVVELEDRYIARPDILSKDVYGDVIYADLLCKLNGISNPFEMNTGMLIILPSPDDIMDFMYRPTIDECDTNSDNVGKPVAKQKTAKRKANEAIVGDARFKIDKNAGIVIY